MHITWGKETSCKPRKHQRQARQIDYIPVPAHLQLQFPYIWNIGIVDLPLPIV